MSHQSPDVQCSQGGCEQSVKGHAWGKIKAEGWFFQMNGDSWCPEHHPEWVAEWRRNKRAAGFSQQEKP